MCSPPPAILEFAAGLAKCDAFGLATEIDLDDAVRIKEDFCFARLLRELNPFTPNRCDGLTVVGSDDADLILAIVRFEIVCPVFQLLSADGDGMIDDELSRISHFPRPQYSGCGTE